MNRKEYLKKLSELLWDLPKEEREEALEYYENYFEEAGPRKEEEVIRELGNPETVAAMIRDSVRGNEGEGEYREDGYHNQKYEDSNPMMRKRKRESWHFKGDRNRNLLLLILIIVLAGGWLLPAAAALIFGVGGGLLGLTGGMIGIFFALGGGGIGLLAAGIGTLVAGIVKMFSSLPYGLMIAGGGCLMMAAGLLLVMLWVWLIGSVLPRFLRWIVKMIRKIFGKGGEKA